MQTLRGKMWRTFLGLEAVKQEGYYEQLVHQALGNKYSKRKVRVLANHHAVRLFVQCHDWHCSCNTCKAVHTELLIVSTSQVHMQTNSVANAACKHPSRMSTAVTLFAGLCAKKFPP